MRRYFKKIFGLTTAGIIFISVVAGISVKNNSEKNIVKVSNDIKDKTSSFDSNKEIARAKKVCKDFFEKDENAAILQGYKREDVVDCSFVGCGGLY